MSDVLSRRQLLETGAAALGVMAIGGAPPLQARSKSVV